MNRRPPIDLLCPVHPEALLIDLASAPGAEGQTTTRRRFHPVDDGHPEPNVPVARCAGECEGGHATPLAPQGISALLALEVPANGKTRLPGDLRDLIRKMAAENAIWGEERIANELKMKLGIRVSPGTVGKYRNSGGPRREPDPKQCWLTCVRNHAKAIVACDFFVVVMASFHILYVFVIMELGTRRILHHNVTAHPTAEWTLQQFRKALPGDHAYRLLIHDRDSIFSRIWTSKWSRWVCACCELRSGRPKRTLYARFPYRRNRRLCGLCEK